jgi:uncharacterized membrane protein YdbT with pleckstrin-like domain
MTYIENSRAEDEQIKAIFKLHWVTWLPVIFFSITIIGLPVALYMFLQNISIEMGVTTKRIIFKKGFISRETSEQFLKKTESVELQQSILGRILGYGDIRCTATGGSTFVFTCVTDPVSAKRLIEYQLN